MSLVLGDIVIRSVSGGSLKLDGGCMFGVVPKALWERSTRPDELNRIPLATNCLLVEADGRRILIDTGYGPHLTDRQREQCDAEQGHPLLRNLASCGVGPDDIDTVIHTHLHFDHVGGSTQRGGGGQLRPSFPRARYVVQRVEWEDAVADLPELTGAYAREQLQALADADQLDLIDGDTTLHGRIRCRLTGGHTRGHQTLELGTAEHRAVYAGDLCPTSAHLRTAWTMAYDQFPLDVRRGKAQLLRRVVEENSLLLFDHDPVMTAARLRHDDRGQVVVSEQVAI